jgi:mannuronan synthase
MGLALALPTVDVRLRVEKFYFPDWRRGYLALLDGCYALLARHAVLYVVYPHLRRKVRKLGKAADPSHVFLMVTSFRIDALTTAQVYSSVIREAIECGLPTTVVCSLVEMSDELLVKSIWER